MAQVWDLESARCRFGKYLHLAINGSDPDIARLVREFPARRQQSEEGERVQGLPLRLSVFRNGASAELQLGEAARDVNPLPCVKCTLTDQFSRPDRAGISPHS